MASPERKRRGRYNQYLEEENPLGKMPQRMRYRFNKALLATTASLANTTSSATTMSSATTTSSTTIDGKYYNLSNLT